VSGRGETTDADGLPTGRLLGMAPRFLDDALCSLLWDDFTCNIATVARRSCVEAIGGYDESLPANEDWDLWLRLARLAPIAWVDRVVAHARWHDGNTTGFGSPLFRQTQESRTRVLEKVFADGGLPPAAAAMRPAAFTNLHLRSGLHWLAAGDRRTALQQFRRAIAVSGAPTTTLVRIVWRIASIRLLDRLPAGRRLLAWQSRIRRQWRDLQPRHTKTAPIAVGAAASHAIARCANGGSRALAHGTGRRPRCRPRIPRSPRTTPFSPLRSNTAAWRR
jgi:hypothetical protein